MTIIEAIIFDLDGLLLDSEVYWERARREFCGSLGCSWTSTDEAGVKGHNSPEWAEVIRATCGLRMDRTEIISGVTARMRGLYEEHLPVLPGARETVRAVAARYPCAVASSSPLSLIEFVLSAMGVRDFFRMVQSADDAGRGKPAPDVFLRAASLLGVEPENVAVFEDSSAGIIAGHRAGMIVIAVPNVNHPPSEEALALADFVLPSLLAFRVDLLQDVIDPLDAVRRDGPGR